VICQHYTVERRFLTLADVADVLNVSAAQAYALVRSGELRAIKVGGRGQWRVAESDFEEYIQRMYAETKAALQSDDRDPVPDDSQS
jgi:excisionase family DNA binding protein